MRKAPVALGELTEVVALGRKTLTSDGAGGATTADDLYAPEVWAHVRPMDGREMQHAERTEAAGMFLVTVRNRDDVQVDDFVRWNGIDLNVRFPRLRGPREHMLELECEIGAAT